MTFRLTQRAPFFYSNGKNFSLPCAVLLGQIHQRVHVHIRERQALKFKLNMTERRHPY